MFINHDYIMDPHGRFIILDIELPDVACFLLINLYAPNNDNPDFFKNLAEIAANSETTNYIFTGDWNLVIDPTMDTFNYKNVNNPKSKSEVGKIMVKLDLIDIWRKTYPNQKKFTWRQEGILFCKIRLFSYI